MTPEAGESWLAFVKGLVDREDSRKSSLETRCVGVAGASAALIAVVTAVAALATNASKVISTQDKTLIVSALLCHIASIILAAFANSPARFVQADPEALLDEIQKNAHISVENVLRRQIATLCVEYSNLSAVNRTKVAYLTKSFVFLIGGCLVQTVVVFRLV